MSTAIEYVPDRDAELEPRTYGDPVGADGDLLSLEEGMAAARAMKIWQAQHDFMLPLIEQWKLNSWLRRGITGARLIHDPISGKWRARAPSNFHVNPDVANHAASLCRKMTGVLTADPPAPDAVPGEGEGDDPSAAEFATRVLVHLDAELRRTKKLRRAIDLSHTCGSAFERFYYDPHAGGRVPLEIEAGFDPATGAEALTVFDAEFRIDVDPWTGAAVRIPWPKRRKRFVRADGSLTAERKEAATRFQGAIRSEVIRANNVRLYPHTAVDIEDAYGVGILAFIPWGQVRKMFPDRIEALELAQRDKIFGWRPDWAESALPQGTDRRTFEASRMDGNEDERLVPVLTTIFDGSKCPGDYPKGLYMVQLADCVVLHRATWEYEDAHGVMRPKMIPLAQLGLFEEGRDHWAHVGLMEIIGPGNEVRAAQIGSLLDYLDRLGSIKTLVPSTSTIDPLEYADRTKRFLSFDSAGGTPVPETLPPYPAAAAAMFETMTGEMNNASGLQETGQGLEVGNIKSGVQAMTVISQIQAALSPQGGAVQEFYIRGCRILLELVRAHYTRPRQMSWTGDDGRHKQRAWERSDLGSTTDVRIDPSTGTMLRPAQKALLAREYFQLGILPPDEFRQATEKSLGGTLALQDDPFRQRIRRQIEDWKQGPPEGWTPPPPLMAPQTQPDPITGLPVPVLNDLGEPVMAPVIDPATGLPQMQPDPVAEAIWAPVPSDSLPAVAQTRLTELARLTATVAYEQLPPAWRFQVEQEFARMKLAAAPPTPMKVAPTSEEGPADEE